MRQHLEAVLAKPVAQVAGHAVKERITPRHHDHFLRAEVTFQRVQNILQVRADAEVQLDQLRHQAERLLAAQDQIG